MVISVYPFIVPHTPSGTLIIRRNINISLPQSLREFIGVIADSELKWWIKGGSLGRQSIDRTNNVGIVRGRWSVRANCYPDELEGLPIFVQKYGVFVCG